MTIIDMGRKFDGRCAVCREYINPGDYYRVLDEQPNEDVEHAVVHALSGGDEIPCETT